MPFAVRSRTMKELRDFLDGLTDGDSTEREKTLAEDLLAFLSGELTERQMTGRIERLLA